MGKKEGDVKNGPYLLHGGVFPTFIKSPSPSNHTKIKGSLLLLTLRSPSSVALSALVFQKKKKLT